MLALVLEPLGRGVNICGRLSKDTNSLFTPSLGICVAMIGIGHTRFHNPCLERRKDMLDRSAHSLTDLIDDLGDITVIIGQVGILARRTIITGSDEALDH